MAKKRSYSAETNNGLTHSKSTRFPVELMKQMKKSAAAEYKGNVSALIIAACQELVTAEAVALPQERGHHKPFPRSNRLEKMEAGHVEEVLSGMDRFLAQLDRRVSTLEGKFAALVASLTGGTEVPAVESTADELSKLRADLGKWRDTAIGKR